MARRAARSLSCRRAGATHRRAGERECDGAAGRDGDAGGDAHERRSEALALYAVPQPPEAEGDPDEPWGTVLFATAPGTTDDPFGMAMTPEGRLFVARNGGAIGRTREYTAELSVVRTFESPRVEFASFTSGLAWMPPEHAPPGHPEGTLWWLDVSVDCDGPACMVEITRLIEGDLDGNETGRTIEAVTGPGQSGPLSYDRGFPLYLAYDVESSGSTGGSTGLFYYIDWLNEDTYAVDVGGTVPPAYPAPPVDYDPDDENDLLQSGLDAPRGADGGTYLEAMVTVPEDTVFERVVVADRAGASTGVETPLRGPSRRMGSARCSK